MKRINSTVWELVLGIALTGIVLELLILLFLPDKLSISLGLLIGMLTASAMVFHMYYSITKILDMGEGAARKGAAKGYAVRTISLVAVLLVVAVTKKANLLSCVAGVFTLKVAVYLQPFTHRIIRRVKE